jgi:hypothetical protein
MTLITVRRPVGSRRAVQAVVIIVVVALVGAGYYWRTHPGRIHGGIGDSESFSNATVGTAYSFAAGIESTGSVKLIKVVPVMTENTNDSTVQLTLCGSNVPISGYNGGGTFTGLITHICSTVAQPVGATTVLGYDTPKTNILVTITPRRRGGTVTVAGVSITYEHGLQRGTVVAGQDWSATTH